MTDTADPPKPATLIAWACVVETLSMVSISTFPALIPVFQREWDLANTAAGTIAGAYFAGMAVAVAVLTALTDRIDAKRIFMASLGIGAVSSLGFALFAGDAWSAGVWRLLQGIGLGGTYMPGLRILTDHLPSSHRSRGTAFYTATFFFASGLSYLVALELEPAVGWAWTFGLCALGPALGLVIAVWRIPSGRLSDAAPEGHFLDYRPALRNRRALGFSCLYGLHTLELIAFSSWLVPFLVFSQTLRVGQGGGAGWSLGLIVALVTMVALPASLAGNEAAHRVGRHALIGVVMVASGAIGVAFGLLAAAPFWLVVTLAFVYSMAIAADSSAITAGVIDVAEPHVKGLTMSLHSVLGFAGGFVGPIIFGAVLDLGGGEGDHTAWILAFAAIAFLLLLGPALSYWIMGRRHAA